MSEFLRTSTWSISKKYRPALSMVMVIRSLLGTAFCDTDEGWSTTTGSSGRNWLVKIKNVTNRNARSTIGVISSEGLLLGIFILGILLPFFRLDALRF